MWFLCFLGYIYAIGGCNDKGLLRTVEQYNMEKERWTHCKKLEKPIQNHAAASHIEMVRLSEVRQTMHTYTHTHP